MICVLSDYSLGANMPDCAQYKAFLQAAHAS